MIINPETRPTLAKRVRYSHSTNIIRNTSETAKFMSTFRSSLPIKRSMSVHTVPISTVNYNHYYIDPQLRYKYKSTDPKQNKQTLVNQNFLYEKLHDAEFNHWKHPFEKRAKQAQSIVGKLAKQDIVNLLKFKSRLQGSKTRVPIVVEKYIEKDVEEMP